MENISDTDINCKSGSKGNCNSNVNSLVTETNNNEKDALNFEFINQSQNGIICEEMTKQNVKFSSIDSTEIAERMKNLCLSVEKEVTDYLYCLAGYIKAVIWDSETVIIQMAMGSKLLGVGTMLFLQKASEDDEQTSQENYREIGFISDIFGSVNEPLYTMQLKQRGSVGDFLQNNAKVFYFHNHPSTRYISVTRDDNNQYLVIEN